MLAKNRRASTKPAAAGVHRAAHPPARESSLGRSCTESGSWAGIFSPIDDDVIAAYEGHPTLRALLDLSEGKRLDAVSWAKALGEARQVSREMGIGFIAAISIPFGESCENR